MFIGAVLLIILTEIFIRTAGSLSGWLDYLIASIVVGFIVGEDIYKSMFNGVITTLIGGIIVIIIEILMLEGNFDLIQLLLIVIFSTFVMIVMGIIGGLTGSFFERITNSSPNLSEKNGDLPDSTIKSKTSSPPVYKKDNNLAGSLIRFKNSLSNLPEKKERYLKCKSCCGKYVLEPDELPGDFESCSCGGELEFYDTYGRKRPYTSSYPTKKEMSLGTKILILVVVGIFSLYYLFPYIMFALIGYLDPSAGIYIFPIFFAVSIAAIIILIWYGFFR